MPVNGRNAPPTDLRRSSRLVVAGCLVLLAAAVAPAALGAPRSLVAGGDAQYQVSIADVGHPTFDPIAGFYTAWTGIDHPVTDLLGKFGFLCDFDPRGREDWEPAAASITHSSLRSYGSGRDYPLGTNPSFLREPMPGFECRPTSEWTSPLIEQVFEDSAPVGVRASWSIVDGPDDLDVELLLRSRGSDMMTGAVELSMRVLNRSSEPTLIGVRHLLQLRRSGTRGTSAGIRFLGLRSPGQPDEPLSQFEQAWTSPAARAWDGWAASDTPYSRPSSDVYAVAGALAGPESLDPVPTPPDLLQWAQVDTFGADFFPGLADGCFEWEAPAPPRLVTNSAAVALTWGHDEEHALELDPGGEVTLTTYLMAFITYPLEAETFGPWERECEGPSTEVPVRAEALPLYDTEAEIFHEWSSSDPRVSFLDPRAAETVALVEGSGTFPVHHRTWVGPWEAHADDEIVVTDSQPPTFEALSVSPSSLWPPNHRLEDVEVDWTVRDACDPAPTVRLVSVTSNEPERRLPGWGAGNTEQDILGAEPGTPDREFQLRAERAGVGAGRAYTLTYEAEDSAGNVSTERVVVRVEHDRGSRRR